LHVNVGPIHHPLIIFEKEFANKPYQIDVVRTMVEPDPLLLRSRFIGDGGIVKTYQQDVSVSIVQHRQHKRPKSISRSIHKFVLRTSVYVVLLFEAQAGLGSLVPEMPV
jgi:hypothetical protein